MKYCKVRKIAELYECSYLISFVKLLWMIIKRHFVTMLTSEKPDIERIYMETPTVTEGPGSI